MQLETQRLILRDWHPTQDARHALDIFGDTRVTAWLENSTKDTSIRQSQGRLQRYLDNAKNADKGARSWAVEQKDIGRIIGHVILAELPDLKQVRIADSEQPPNTVNPEGMPTDYIEIGWHFRPASWGYGYATEAAFCITEYAFKTLQLPILLAITDPKNRRSVGVIQRLGMHYDGMTTRYYRGEELLLYKLTPEDFSDAQERRNSEMTFLKALNEIETNA